jgi:hypothetical protein
MDPINLLILIVVVCGLPFLAIWAMAKLRRKVAHTEIIEKQEEKIDG